jgi:hypothetical protein
MNNRKAAKNKSNIVKVTSGKKITVYINDPYFVEKRETAAAFLRKFDLPESFTKLNR